ncbi:MAG: 4Fe-4S dicluster domain-containing protein [Verrucomicrobia bacterium]|nr:4Fe-4S dicluster domain-containing protein [Verrucomicrobiota bacterium]
MPTTPLIVNRPQRWDAAFDPAMTDEDAQRLMFTAPFSQMSEEKFPKRTPLRDILRNDSRIRRFKQGEIIVRHGDYGTSAFLILNGAARVVLKPPLPARMLGRAESKKKNVFRMLSQAWNSWREPESFRLAQLRADVGVDARTGTGEDVHVFLQDLPRVLNQHRTEAMQGGEFFGEIAALSRMPRTSTIFADTDDTELLEVRWQGLRDLMKYDDALQKHIESVYRERALRSYLRAIPIFKHLTKEQENVVVGQTEFATYGDYDWSGDYKKLLKSGGAARPDQEPVVAAEGDYPNGVVFVRAGFARMSQKFGNGQRTLNYLGAGQNFGFREIAHNWRKRDAPVDLQHSLRAIGYAHFIIVPTEVMEKIVLPTVPVRELPELIEPKAEEISSRRDSHAAEKIGTDLMEFLAEHRFFNGTATMLIDLDRCTRCDDCVRACASTHDNNPRFLRHGPSNGRVMVANACMHCADPVCMIGCPTGAIHRESAAGQVVINPLTCIGCSLCANNCPYEAIRMTEIRDTDGAFLVDKSLRPISKATKCDLCVENHGGPACERACPHGALTRMNMGDLDTFAKWLKR